MCGRTETNLERKPPKKEGKKEEKRQKEKDDRKKDRKKRQKPHSWKKTITVCNRIFLRRPRKML